ncbi:MAG: GNAT family N-acetyltransferase [Nitrospirae bacterium]|jgi:hypothetical protein|nr:GNAT family N-acetyltransferase [Nitrospirota bacterium]
MNSFIIREYKSGDEKYITMLFKEVFGKDMTVEQWKWKYYIPGNGKIYSKIAEDSNGNLIGHAGAIPLKGLFKGKPYQFFQIADVMVHPKARGFFGTKNIFSMIIKKLFEDIAKAFTEVFCYGFPGHRPFILGKRIDVYDEIEKAVDYTKTPKYTFFNKCKIKNLEWNDIEINNLWNSISNSLGLSVIRDTAYLNWRYALNPFNNYQLYGAFHSGILKCWFVTKEQEDELFIIDFMSDLKLFRQALKAFEKIFAHKKKIHIWVSKPFKESLKNYNIEQTQIITTNMIWKLPLKTDIVKKNLFYTMGDVDIF